METGMFYVLSTTLSQCLINLDRIYFKSRFYINYVSFHLILPLSDSVFANQRFDIFSTITKMLYYFCNFIIYSGRSVSSAATKCGSAYSRLVCNFHYVLKVYFLWFHKYPCHHIFVHGYTRPVHVLGCWNHFR